MKWWYDLRWFRNVFPAVVMFIFIVLLPVGVMAATPGAEPLNPGPPDSPTEAVNEAVQVQVYTLPLSFIPNVGQVDPAVAFTVTGHQSMLYFTPDAVVITSREGEGTTSVEQVIRQTFPGSAASPVIEGSDPLPGVANYFTGSDPSGWQSNVPTYGSIQYRNMYPGIDLRYKGTEGILKREFIVAPGADPAAIRLHYEGVDSMRVDKSGALILSTGNSTLTESPVICYQEIGGWRIIIPAGYYPAGDRDITFSIGAYDPSFPLVIDPALVYSTYLGAGEGYAIAVDSGGNAYVTGHTYGFPTTAGAYNRTEGGYKDAFVTKLNPSGSALVYSTYLGGSGFDYGRGIAVDTSGNAYVTGFTDSSDFPTTAGAYNRTYSGGDDVFIAKLDPTGSALVYSTYLGGSVDYLGLEGDDEGCSIAVDSSGNAYVTGGTKSLDFPTTGSAYDRTYNGDYDTFDVFVTKLNPAGSALVYSTFLGSKSGDTGYGIAVDTSGSAYVTGDAGAYDFPTTAGAYDRTYSSMDAFVAKLNPAGSSLVYSTFLGGDTWDVAHGIAVDTSGSAFVTGETRSYDFPTTAGAYNRTFGGGYFDAFVTKLNPAGSSLVYSTFLGGSGGNGDDFGYGIAVDTSGNVYVTGETDSSDFPTTISAYNRTYGGEGLMDVFVTKLNRTGSALVYSTYLGGPDLDEGYGIAVDSSGNAYVTGETWSTNFPTTGDAYDRTGGVSIDVFVAKFFTETGPVQGSDIGMFRSGQWILDYGMDGTVNRRFNFGLATDIPVVGDFNNDGTTDIGVYRSGQWILDYGIDGTVDRRFQFGQATDTPLVGDFNNDGTIDIGVYRSGQWILDYGMDGSVNRRFNYGLATDIPIVGDFNNDGTTDIGVFRSGQWILDYGMDGTVNRRFNYGLATDKPLIGDFNNDGTPDIGVFRSGQWILDYGMDGTVNRRFNYGLATDIPVVGKWT